MKMNRPLFKHVSGSHMTVPIRTVCLWFSQAAVINICLNLRQVIGTSFTLTLTNPSCEPPQYDISLVLLSVNLIPHHLTSVNPALT
jgi:hypothetical protein